LRKKSKGRERREEERREEERKRRGVCEVPLLIE
jgi:hypothetical protein